MRSRIEKLGLIGLGVVAGVLLSLQFSALAEKEAAAPQAYQANPGLRK